MSRDERQTIDAVSRANERFGGVYALVHIAGGAGPKRARDIEDFQLQDWAHVIDLNLTSAFLAARAAVPLMRPQRRGRIVLFSSIIADGENGPLTTVTGRLPYATAKAALLGFTSQLAKDLAEWGITVNALMPGLILGEQGTRIRDRFDRLEPRGAGGDARRLSRRQTGQRRRRRRSGRLLAFRIGRLHFGCRVAGRRCLPLAAKAASQSIAGRCR